MPEPRVVTPQEAQEIERQHQPYEHEEPPICQVCEDETGDPLDWPCEDNRLAHTVATEPERTRAAVAAVEDALTVAQRDAVKIAAAHMAAVERAERAEAALVEAERRGAERGWDACGRWIAEGNGERRNPYRVDAIENGADL